MKGVRLNIKGNWAQFRRSETNNNPLSHDFITKTAMMGMIGAVLGKNREEMRHLFPVLCDDLKYGVQVKNEVKKQSWGFTFRSVTNAWDKVPKQMEFIRNPEYEVILCLADHRSEAIYTDFVECCREGKACYEPVLGLHNCPAEIRWEEEGIIEYMSDGCFDTKGFVTSKHVPEGLDASLLRIGFDRVPTFQNDDFWNLPERYISVVYPSGGHSIKVQGEYYLFNGQTEWCLI